MHKGQADEGTRMQSVLHGTGHRGIATVVAILLSGVSYDTK